MPLRTFLASDGTHWMVWLVRPGGTPALPGTPPEWLAFQNADESERRRLVEVPSDWEELSDERLELVRRLATPVPPRKQRHAPPPRA